MIRFRNIQRSPIDSTSADMVKTPACMFVIQRLTLVQQYHRSFLLILSSAVYRPPRRIGNISGCGQRRKDQHASPPPTGLTSHRTTPETELHTGLRRDLLD